MRRCFLLERGGEGLDAFVDVIPEQCHSFVILNLFQDNEPRSHVILKQVQDDDGVFLGGRGDVAEMPFHLHYKFHLK